MSDLSEKEKLRILIDHWIVHNQGHVDECREWLEKVGGLEEDAATAIGEAISGFNQAGTALGRALAAMGGPVEGHHH